MRIAHLSDPHLAPLPPLSWRDFLSKRVIGFLNWRLSRAGHLTRHFLDLLVEDLHRQKPTHILVTGDLVNLALEEEFRSAAHWLRNLGSPQNVSVVPGNHDAYVPGALERAYANWGPYMRGDQLQDPLFDEVVERETRTKEKPSEDSPSFPYLRRRGNLAIIGVSTAVASLPFCAIGAIDLPQRERLARILHAPELQPLFRLLCLHHPPLPRQTGFNKRLLGAKTLCKLFERAPPHMILHGHTHEATLFYLTSQGGSVVPIVGVPSASKGPGGHRPPAGYNLFTIAQGSPSESWHVTHERRGLSQEGTHLVRQSQQLLLPAFSASLC